MKNQYKIPQTDKEKKQSMLRKLLVIVVLFAAIGIFIFSGAAAWLVKTVAGQPTGPLAAENDPIKQLIAQGVDWTFSQTSDAERVEQLCAIGTQSDCNMARQYNTMDKYPGVTFSDLVIVGKVDEGKSPMRGVADQTWEIQIKLGGEYTPDFNDGFWSNDEKARWAEAYKTTFTPTLPNDVYTAYIRLEELEPGGEWRFSGLMTGQGSMRYVMDLIPNIKATQDASLEQHRKSTSTPKP